VSSFKGFLVSGVINMFVTAKCIDQYVKLRVANADGNDEPVPMDSRLEGVVEKMFNRCIKDRQYKQVLCLFHVLFASSADGFLHCFVTVASAAVGHKGICSTVVSAVLKWSPWRLLEDLH